MPKAAELAPTSGTYSLAQGSPFVFYTPPAVNLPALYQELGYLTTASTGFAGANGRPFSEAEIAEAFAAGKGPYRTSCSQVTFGGDTNCRIVTNPLDRAQEVLLSREANLFTQKLEALEAAIATNDARQVQAALRAHPALVSFIANDSQRWTSPSGTWRMRLLQDAGVDALGGAGFPVLSDAEMAITPAAGTDPAARQFSGVLSVWMPYFELGAGLSPLGVTSHENLSNFAMRFDWLERDHLLLNGELRGARRGGADGAERVDYTATFEAEMSEGNRVTGYWFNDARGMAGRFELIRGLARYSI